MDDVEFKWVCSQNKSLVARNARRMVRRRTDRPDRPRLLRPPDASRPSSMARASRSVLGLRRCRPLIAGGCMFVAGLFKLGSGLTPLPYPRPHAILIQTGPYRLVRHPIYTGGIALAFGWAFIVCGWLTLCYAAVLLIFLDIKSSREELWLMEKFEGYRDYQKRVRKLIPFVR